MQGTPSNKLQNDVDVVVRFQRIDNLDDVLMVQFLE